ncbi:MAG: sialate O-acetylesterase [Planctomycetes bacterium]|nr:sialate O-acetylesterase [Planctomycetota bacterium]
MRSILCSRRAVALAAVAWCCAATIQAEIKLPAVIGSNMVLQQGKPVNVWGQADPGEKVMVALAGQSAEATAGANGRWRLAIEPPALGGPYEMTITGKNRIELNNILVGEVWVCSGQSNMEWTVARSKNPQAEIAAAKFPKIRLFTVTKALSNDEAKSDCVGQWVECSPETVPNFSAVGYFFGRELHQRLNQPIGLINTSWGGTPAEAWTTRATLAANELLKPIDERGTQGVQNLAEAEKKFAEEMAKYREADKQAVADKQPRPRAPRPPLAKGPSFPSTLYNAMVNPLVPLGIRGVIWYQGEANAGRAFQYRTLLPALIGDWRKAFGQGDFPFLVVQLANYSPSRPELSNSTQQSAWAELREAQTMTAANVPNCGLAVSIDIGDALDIHPTNKQDVGRRLALAALAKTYQQQVEYSGPWYAGNDREGSTIRIRYQHAGDGLVAKGEKLLGFAIAGADKKFVPAEARIDGETVVVSSDQVAEPVAVRYAWADNPNCNLYNKAGLPAVPFRTDDWAGVTFAAR